MKPDRQLKVDVVDELSWEPSVNETHIGVSVTDAIVTLSGHVVSYAEKYGAENAAKRVAGVRAVANELDVRVASRHTDENIAAACVDALRAHGAVPDEKLRVVVGGGWVKLEGMVDWPYQREAAERAIRHLDGIRGITNNIHLSPRVSVSEIKGKIEEAFQRSAQIDADQVTVQAHDGVVILYGRVRSWAEKEQAQTIAWSSPGVTSVENEIVVTS